MSPTDAALEHEAPEAAVDAQPPVKKSKTDDAENADSAEVGWPDHVINIADAVMQEHASATLVALCDMPVSALKGIGEKSEAVASVLGVNTVADLASWKFYLMANALVTLSSTEVADGRPKESRMNIDKAVDHEYEVKSLVEIVDAPTGALQGLSDASSDLLGELGVKTIRDLAAWKFPAWAESMVTLSKFENEKSAAERKVESALKRLE